MYCCELQSCHKIKPFCLAETTLVSIGNLKFLHVAWGSFWAMGRGHYDNAGERDFKSLSDKGNKIEAGLLSIWTVSYQLRSIAFHFGITLLFIIMPDYNVVSLAKWKQYLFMLVPFINLKKPTQNKGPSIFHPLEMIWKMFMVMKKYQMFNLWMKSQ